MDTAELEEELKILQGKLVDETITQEEELRFMKLYQKYIRIIEDEVKIHNIRQSL